MTNPSDDIAVIGMACIYPGAPDLNTFWHNILTKVDAVSDPPDDWRADLYYDPNSKASNRIYTKKGGFIAGYTRFNPMEFGIMPSSIEGADPEHFLPLQVAQDALADADYTNRPFNRQRTAVILGRAPIYHRGLITFIQQGIVVDQTLKIIKQLIPEISPETLQSIEKELQSSIPAITPDNCVGMVPNLASGRIANRLDLGGPNYNVDAACASSLIALEAGIRELRSKRCDMALVGGSQVSTPAGIFMVFSQLGALSRRGRIRPFDQQADGTLLGEGIGIVVLKRREDAERDNDRIYALIKAVGISSDGRGVGILVPRVEGEILALERAYEDGGISPTTIGLIEAHGTGTPVGDVAEIKTLGHIFGSQEELFPHLPFGSIKSMIGHTLPAAGMAGFIKSVLALYHKILPPTLCDQPDPEIHQTSLYINTETRPWIHGCPHPRRVGVNSFGFGGINGHAILEEYTNHHRGDKELFSSLLWDSEVIIVQAGSREGLIKKGKQLLNFFIINPAILLKDLAYTLNCAKEKGLNYRLAIVATSLEDLEKKLRLALKQLDDQKTQQIRDRSGIFFFEKPLSREGKVAFLFPGEGSQYPNMFSDLCLHFPEIRDCFDFADRVFIKNGRTPLLSQVLFPPPHSSKETKNASEKKLWEMEYAVLAAHTANQAIFSLLNRLQIKPHAMAGHSIGEESALFASGIVKEQTEEERLEFRLKSDHISRLTRDQIPLAKLMTVGAANPSDVTALLTEFKEKLYVSMDNCPNQVILCGTDEVINKSYEHLIAKGAICNFLPFNRAYHTPDYKPAGKFFAQLIDNLALQSPKIDLYSCSTAQVYPVEIDEMRKIIVDQWAMPVRFRETIQAMYDDGVRIFVETGAKGNLISFVEDTLGNREYASIQANVPTRSGIWQLNFMIGLLTAHDVPMQLDYLYRRRNPKKLSIEEEHENQVIYPDNELEIKPKTGFIQLNQALPWLTLENSIPAITKTDQESPASQTAQSQTHMNKNNPQSKVMLEYFKNMEQVLKSQQKSLEVYLEKKRKNNPVGKKERN